MTQLTPAARARVEEILGPDRTMASVASWADEVRRSRPETAPWHFVDIPINQTHLDMQRDCAKGDCIVGEIAVLRQKLQDPAIAPDQRREALMFLIHFIGDMHQPLHCSDDEDRGGNTVRVVFHDHQTNLHSVWDSGLLSRMPPEDRLFEELSKESARHAKKWSKGTVTNWAEQSHRSAVKTVYGLLPKEPAGTPIPLTGQYETSADPLVKVQIEKAGARLAAVLNQTLR
ncbi:MAG TPA: S1/P1 nuclease [Bryobacteraceae bacterium]|nr:S1/P1 nuclease [Bryobacteraceae bacterium]